MPLIYKQFSASIFPRVCCGQRQLNLTSAAFVALSNQPRISKCLTSAAQLPHTAMGFCFGFCNILKQSVFLTLKRQQFLGCVTEEFWCQWWWSHIRSWLWLLLGAHAPWPSSALLQLLNSWDLTELCMWPPLEASGVPAEPGLRADVKLLFPKDSFSIRNKHIFYVALLSHIWSRRAARARPRISLQNVLLSERCLRPLVAAAIQLPDSYNTTLITINISYIFKASFWFHVDPFTDAEFISQKHKTDKFWHYSR